MCTVTFIPMNNKIFITHNRDEKSSRSKAIPPKQYTLNGYTLLFPRDSTAGGSWIASNKNGGAAVLLNGAFEKHQHQPPYRKSRGLAFLDIIAANDLYLSYQQTDLTGIEPFTVILWANNKLYECRWNGTKEPSNGPGRSTDCNTLCISRRNCRCSTWRCSLSRATLCAGCWWSRGGSKRSARAAPRSCSTARSGCKFCWGLPPL